MVRLFSSSGRANGTKKHKGNNNSNNNQSASSIQKHTANDERSEGDVKERERIGHVVNDIKAHIHTTIVAVYEGWLPVYICTCLRIGYMTATYKQWNKW